MYTYIGFVPPSLSLNGKHLKGLSVLVYNYYSFVINKLKISIVCYSFNILALPNVNIFCSEIMYKYPEVVMMINVVKNLF